MKKNKKRAARRSRRIKRSLFKKHLANKKRNRSTKITETTSCLLNYNNRINLLLAKGIIKSKDYVFFPQEGDCFSELSNFYQEYLESTSFGFSAPIFFFGSEKSLNAWAWKNKGLDVICINKHSVAFVNELIDQNEDFINRYLENRRINTCFDNGLPATTIMKQMMEMFLFYHELGHLVQEQDPVLSSYFVEEVNGSKKFDIIDHVSEFDADIFASVKLASHVFMVYRRQAGLNTDKKKGQFLEDSCIIAITSYVIYRLIQFPDYGDFYTEKYTHPHIIIRIVALMIHLTTTTIENSKIELSEKRILEEAINFVEEFAKKLPDHNAAISFIRMGQTRFDEILQYILKLNAMAIRYEGSAHKKSQKKINND